MSTRAFFVSDGDAFAPTDWARGPWGHAISGNYVGGLLGHVIERDAGDHELQPARLTVDLFRPAALADPVRVETCGGAGGPQAQARRCHHDPAGHSRREGQRAVPAPGRTATRPEMDDRGDDAAGPSDARPRPRRRRHTRVDVRKGRRHTEFGLAAWAHHGPKYIWTTDLGLLVDGTELTPFARAAMAGDMSSSLTHFGADGLPFINADYTLTLSRLPDGPYLGLAALTHHSHAGVATGTAVVVDGSGPIGTASATALANPGFNPPRASLS